MRYLLVIRYLDGMVARYSNQTGEEVLTQIRERIEDVEKNLTKVASWTIHPE